MNRVGELIATNNSSQKELAITLGVAQPSVSAWVSNKADPTTKNAQRIANLFHTSVDYVLGGNSEAPAPVWTPDEYAAHGVAARTNLSPAELDAIAVKVKALIGGAYNLTPSEQALINKFRLLSNTQKSHVRAMIAGYLDAKFSEE